MNVTSGNCNRADLKSNRYKFKGIIIVGKIIHNNRDNEIINDDD